MLLGCCSGIHARQTLAFTQAKPECDERKTRQVLHVRGMKKARETGPCVGAVPAGRSLLEREHVKGCASIEEGRPFR